MTLPDLLAAAVIVLAVPLNWLVTIRLWRLHRANPDLRALTERAYIALAIALLVTIFALVFLNNSILDVPILDMFTTQIITRVAVLLLSVPAIYWLWLYRRS